MKVQLLPLQFQLLQRLPNSLEVHLKLQLKLSLQRLPDSLELQLKLQFQLLTRSFFEAEAARGLQLGSATRAADRLQLVDVDQLQSLSSTTDERGGGWCFPPRWQVYL